MVQLATTSTDDRRAWLYCATCDITRNDYFLSKREKDLRNSLVKQLESIEIINDLLTGRRFECPLGSLSDPHVAAVAKDPTGRKWLRGQHWLMRYQSSRFFLLIPPTQGREVRWSIGVVIVWLVVAFLALAWQNIRLPELAGFFALLVIIDALFYNTSTVFATQKPRNPLRTIAFAMAAFGELTVAFAVLYLSLPPGSLDRQQLNWLDAVYFSFVTVATLGYGDIQPCEEAWHAQLLVVGEILVGLYFLAVILTSMVSWANPRQGLPGISELVDESNKLTRDVSRYTLPNESGKG